MTTVYYGETHRNFWGISGHASWPVKCGPLSEHSEGDPFDYGGDYGILRYTTVYYGTADFRELKKRFTARGFMETLIYIYIYIYVCLSPPHHVCSLRFVLKAFVPDKHLSEGFP